MALLTPTGFLDLLNDDVLASPARGAEDLLGGLEGHRSEGLALRFSAGSGAPDLYTVPSVAVDTSVFAAASAIFGLDDGRDAFVLGGTDDLFGGDWSDLAVSAGARAGRGFENPGGVQRTVPGPDWGPPPSETPPPEVWPGAADDDFVLVKDADLPEVLPGIDEIEPVEPAWTLAGRPVQLDGHMLTLGDDGFLLGPTVDPGRLHDHDGWLF